MASPASLQGMSSTAASAPGPANHLRSSRAQAPTRRRTCRALVAALLASAIPLANAQACVYLGGSSTCPGFNTSYISTDSKLTGLYPFLSNVTDTASFDTQLAQYVRTTYAQLKYSKLFGCSSLTTNTTDIYARYTYSFICNAIVQNSLQPCQISTSDAPPLCADSCSEFALSEQSIISSPDLCGTPSNNAIAQLRADFTDCALPANSISGTCVPGYVNEPTNCGFQYDTEGFCAYCASSTVNNTDSCCVTGQSEQRCQNVKLPTFVSMQPLFPTTTTGAPTATNTATSLTNNGTGSSGLTGGQIAGIVVGSVVGAALVIAIILCGCLLARRKRERDASSSLNQPSPPISRDKPKQSPFEAVPGARVTRMAALEGSAEATPTGARGTHTPHAGVSDTEAAYGAAGMAAVPRRDKSQPEATQESSPEGVGYSSGDNSGSESQQMESFKDYYSNDEIHPNDTVSTLWAYQPRANDEFELERGDMLRIVGIWDDGWATGVRVSERAEQWSPERSTQRDSGVSGGTTQEPPPSNGEVKAFPLVCVCLPQHWKKTIEGDPNEANLSDDPPE